MELLPAMWLAALCMQPASSSASPPGPEPARSLLALEQAYEAYPLPEILLNMASVYERWEGHCDAAVAAYQRFFEACKTCESLAEGVRRFDLTLEKCAVDIDQEIAVREKLAIPKARSPKPVPGDATRKEVLEAIRQAREVDEQQATSLLSKLVLSSLGRTTEAAVLNQLRKDAWAIASKHNASEEQALYLLNRIHKVAPDKHAEMVERLLNTMNEDPASRLATLNELRDQALRLLDDSSSGLPRSEPRISGCQPNNEREWGFLTIDTTPWSVIYVDGQKIGSTPVSRVNALAGCVTVRAVAPGGREVLRNVTVRPNKTARIAIDLTSGQDEVRYDNPR